MNWNAHRFRRAFTLVEAIASIVVIAVLAGVSSMMVQSGVTAVRDGAARAALHAEVSQALDVIVRELRPIRAGGGSGVALDELTATRVALTSGRSIEHVGGVITLSEASTGVSAVLARDVTAMQFAAFDQNGAALAMPLSDASLAAVRRVQVSITATRAGQSESARTRVYLRLSSGATP
ncbi:prepilin-type N-terminal cleavage/methylation domain-containing protein [Leptolyngbya sp. 15MV]|nr:prepilin-type N-terminal cleavage/methylation domain-containing protein [Leptolyngbya sp. 15MV]